MKKLSGADSKFVILVTKNLAAEAQEKLLAVYTRPELDRLSLANAGMFDLPYHSGGPPHW